MEFVTDSVFNIIPPMLQTYIKLAFRNFSKYKVYSIINLLGLSIGLTVGVLILLFVTDELSFDQFHANRDRVYKIVTASPDGGMEANAWPVAYKLKNEFPEVETIVYTRGGLTNMMLNHEGNRYSHNLHFASEDFFQIFSFPFLEGDAVTALKEPYSIVITEEVKRKYFGEAIALGKQITLRDSLEFIITGVLENLPSQSHIQFDLLASFTTYEQLTPWFSYSEGWGNFNVRNYLLLKEGANIEALKAKSSNLYFENVGEWLEEMGVEFYVDFEPLIKVYLQSNYSNGFGPQGSMDQVRLVSVIGLFVIVLACINIINITTARSIYRAREVGLRKVIGSSRKSLFLQFMMESLMLTVLAFAFVALIIDLVLPFFNLLMDREYSISALLHWKIVLGTVMLILSITFLSGYYPAVILSGFKPVEVLRGRIQSTKKGIQLRRGLVVFQFLITAVLILGTLLVVNQLDFMRDQDLGFDEELVLVIDARNVPSSTTQSSFMNELQSLSQVQSVSFTNALPGRPGWQGQWAYPGEFSEDSHVDTEYMAIDEHYIETLGLELIAGENFSLDKPAELKEGLIINETTVKEMGWEFPENAIGKQIVSPSQHPAGTVIGVVKDYHGQGLQYNIWPKAMDYSSQQYGRYYAVRFQTGSTSEMIESISQAWKSTYTDYNFEYFFLDDDFDRQYQAEEQLMKVLMLFASLGILIACIGLLGLISFMILTRYREIGIRKVLGASALNITGNLSREFLILVVIADLIAIPLVWYFGNQWIENFAYHTVLSPLIFVINLIVTIMIAALTISFQTFKAASMNPVDSLKSE